MCWTYLVVHRADSRTVSPESDSRKRRGERSILSGADWNWFLAFFKSIYVGGKLIFGHRKFCWLFPSYALALYLHRYLENGIAPAFARRVLNYSAWSQILVGGSNLGELVGAFCVLLLASTIPTPIPWLRLDALALNVNYSNLNDNVEAKLTEGSSFGSCPPSHLSLYRTKFNGLGT